MKKTFKFKNDAVASYNIFAKPGIKWLINGNSTFDWNLLNLPESVQSIEEWRQARDMAQLRCGDWTDKDIIHGYLDTYWEYTKGRGMKVDSVLEIGVKYGHSLCIWNTWFSSPKIFGIDIVLPENHKLETVVVESPPTPTWGLYPARHRPSYLVNLPENITLIEADICKFNGLDGERFDLIIDDASHKPDHQLFVLNKYYKNLNKNGLLIVEDIRTPAVLDILYENFIGKKENLIRHYYNLEYQTSSSNALIYINKQEE